VTDSKHSFRPIGHSTPPTSEKTPSDDDSPTGEQVKLEPNEEIVENTVSGVSITAKVKRGSGTRDQDTIKVKAKGKAATEAIENMDNTIEHVEQWAKQLRAIQPDNSDEDES